MSADIQQILDEAKTKNWSNWWLQSRLSVYLGNCIATNNQEGIDELLKMNIFDYTDCGFALYRAIKFQSPLVDQLLNSSSVHYIEDAILKEAVKSNQVELVKKLLPFYPEMKTDELDLLLHCAEKNYLEIAQEFISHGVKPTQPALREALGRNHYKMSKLILENYDESISIYQMRRAISSKNPQIVELLLSYNPPKSFQLIQHTYQYGTFEIFKLLMDYGYQCQPPELYHLVANKAYQWLEVVLEAGYGLQDGLIDVDYSCWITDEEYVAEAIKEIQKDEQLIELFQKYTTCQACHDVPDFNPIPS